MCFENISSTILFSVVTIKIHRAFHLQKAEIGPTAPESFNQLSKISCVERESQQSDESQVC